MLSLCAEAQVSSQGKRDRFGLPGCYSTCCASTSLLEKAQDSRVVNSVCVSRSFCCSLLWSGGAGHFSEMLTATSLGFQGLLSLLQILVDLLVCNALSWGCDPCLNTEPTYILHILKFSFLDCF